MDDYDNFSGRSVTAVKQDIHARQLLKTLRCGCTTYSNRSSSRATKTASCAGGSTSPIAAIDGLSPILRTATP